MKRIAAVLVAVVLAVIAITVTPSWGPYCAGLTINDPLYYVLGCFIDPPPGNPYGS